MPKEKVGQKKIEKTGLRLVFKEPMVVIGAAASAFALLALLFCHVYGEHRYFDEVTVREVFAVEPVDGGTKIWFDDNDTMLVDCEVSVGEAVWVVSKINYNYKVVKQEGICVKY